MSRRSAWRWSSCCFALKDSIVFFHIPSDVLEKGVKAGERIRLGGLVEKGSVVRGQGTTVTFKVTDTLKDIPVTFTGVLPDLFREGQGVVAEGVLDGSGNFKADSVLAKHDQNYMPPNVAKALRSKGRQAWRQCASGRTEGRGTLKEASCRDRRVRTFRFDPRAARRDGASWSCLPSAHLSEMNA